MMRNPANEFQSNYIAWEARLKKMLLLRTLRTIFRREGGDCTVEWQYYSNNCCHIWSFHDANTFTKDHFGDLSSSLWLDVYVMDGTFDENEFDYTSDTTSDE